MAVSEADIVEIVRHGDIAALGEALAQEPRLAEASAPGGASLLSFAIYSGQPAAAQLIRKARGAITPYEAITIGEMDSLRAALEDGWNPNALAPDGFSPLALAAFFDNGAAFELLLPLTDNVNLRAENPQRVAAIHAAAAARNLGAIENLLRAGADPNLPQQAGYRPLHTAAQNGDAAMVGLLLLFGADPALSNDAGHTPRHSALAGGHEWLAQRLAVPAPPP
jgi:ankyrin repeat protein